MITINGGTMDIQHAENSSGIGTGREGSGGRVTINGGTVNAQSWLGGAGAFSGCTGLSKIRLPRDCGIDETAFEGCGTVYVFAPAGGTAQAFCAAAGNCVFVAE